MPTSMSSLPSPPPLSSSDLSVRVLDRILGSGWTQYPYVGTGEAGDSMLFPILAQFNTIALFLVSVLFVWVMAQGVMHTAHEGEPLGKRYSTLWTPIRLSLSTAFLAPIFKGLSLWQVAILYCISFSISFANGVWETGLQYLSSNSGQIVAIAPDTVYESTKRLANLALQSQLMQVYASEKLGLPASGTQMTQHVDHGDSGSQQIYTVWFVPPLGLDARDMGYFFVPCEAGSEAVCQAQISGLNALINDLGAVAKDLVSDDAKPSPSAYAQAVQRYNTSLAQAFAASTSGQAAKVHSEFEAFRATATSNGWASAGQYYWTVTRLAQKAQDAMQSTVRTVNPNEDKFSRKANFDFDGYWSACKSYIKEASFLVPGQNIGWSNSGREERIVMVKAAEAGTSDGIWSGFQQAFNFLSFYPLEFIATQLTHDDPIATVSNIGHYIIGLGQTGVAAYIAVAAGAGGLDGIASSAWGQVVGFFSGGASKGFTEAAKLVVTVLAPMMTILVIALITLGFVWAFYLPSLPFILWASSVAGWLMLVVESLVAAPLWIAAHAIPEGEGMAGQHGRQGYMLLLGVLARPPLMVAGILIAMVLIKGLGWFLGESFLVFARGALAETFQGLFTTIAMTTIICTVVIIMAHKMFGLIVHLPENVIRWIGQHVQNLGEHSDEHRARSIYAGIGGKMESSAAPFARGAGKGSSVQGSSGGNGQPSAMDQELSTNVTDIPPVDEHHQ